MGFLPAVLVGVVSALLNASTGTTAGILLVVVLAKSAIEIRYTKGTRYGRFVRTSRPTKAPSWVWYYGLSLLTEIPLGLIAFYATRLLAGTRSL